MGKKQTAQTLLEADTFYIEEGSQQQYARVLGPRGNHQHEVQFVNGEQTLVTLPPRFRNLVWVKRGHYVVVDPSSGTTSEKVGGEIVHVLFPKHIKQLEQDGKWPSEFSKDKTASSPAKPERTNDEDEEEEEDDLLFVNNNRPIIYETESEDETSDEE
ncbi:uncharacterized protein BYT42DRAFT_589914 [Radiomyces spectabilis]|uniref:uncharacterized protein n=1 Tax=Radiomyces spectabilis TaxID=64574 RepID=UPI002220DEF6|nr:uncharacterized protein BYT42DRAFT_589914 [Radiomyces spectabilis]KAI8364641.1 hypothetical protein BYT42DRAFT_589914 [Radiomyces spectabilis]